MKNKNTISIILVLLILFPLYTYINVNLSYRAATSPDETLALFFSKQIAEKSSFSWHSDLNEKYNVTFFKPRLSIDVGDNNYIGPYVGFNMLLAIARLYDLVDFIVPITGLLGVFFIYLLGRNIFNEKVGILSAIIFGLNPTYVYFANLYLSNVPSVAFVLLSLYCFHKGLSNSKNIFFGLAGLFAMYAMFIRTPEGIIFIVLIMGLIVAKMKFKQSLRLSNVTTLVITFFGLLLLWIFSSQSILSNSTIVPTNNGIHYQVTYLLNHLSIYSDSFRYYILFYPPLLFMLAFFGVSLCRFEKSYKKQIFLYTSILLCVLLFGLYGFRGETWGFGNSEIDSSMARYFIIIYSIFSIYTAYLLNILFKKTNRLHITLFIILLIFTSYTFDDNNGLPKTKNRLDIYGSANREIVTNTPENSVIFTKSWDKIFVWDRNLAVYRTSDDIEENPDIKYFFTPISIDDDIIPIINDLLLSGTSVYVANDADDLLKKLNEYKNYKLVPLNGKVVYNVTLIPDFAS